MIDEEATFKKFGYKSTDLRQYSANIIIVVCDKCGKIREVSKGSYRDLCNPCVKRKEPIELICQTCGKIFEVIPSRKNVAKFCSLECSKNNRGKKHPLYKERIIRRCEFCNKEYEVALTSKTPRFCSRKCKDEWQKIGLKGENNPFYGKHHTQDTIDDHKIKIMEYWNQPGNREAQSERIISYFNEHPEAKERQRQVRLSQTMPTEGTSIELKMREILIDNGYDFDTNIPLLDMCIPDVIFKDKKIIIQCYGDYWHDYPN